MKTDFAACSIFCWTEHGLKVVPASFGSWATVCPSCPITRKGLGDTDAKHCLGCYSGAGTSLETHTIEDMPFGLTSHFKASQNLSSKTLQLWQHSPFSTLITSFSLPKRQLGLLCLASESTPRGQGEWSGCNALARGPSKRMTSSRMHLSEQCQHWRSGCNAAVWDRRHFRADYESRVMCPRTRRKHKAHLRSTQACFHT